MAIKDNKVVKSVKGAAQVAAVLGAAATGPTPLQKQAAQADFNNRAASSQVQKADGTPSTSGKK